MAAVPQRRRQLIHRLAPCCCKDGRSFGQRCLTGDRLVESGMHTALAWLIGHDPRWLKSAGHTLELAGMMHSQPCLILILQDLKALFQTRFIKTQQEMQSSVTVKYQLFQAERGVASCSRSQPEVKSEPAQARSVVRDGSDSSMLSICLSVHCWYGYVVPKPFLQPAVMSQYTHALQI